jgi:hypothetical protein
MRQLCLYMGDIATAISVQQRSLVVMAVNQRGTSTLNFSLA